MRKNICFHCQRVLADALKKLALGPPRMDLHHFDDGPTGLPSRRI